MNRGPDRHDVILLWIAIAVSTFGLVVVWVHWLVYGVK